MVKVSKGSCQHGRVVKVIDWEEDRAPQKPGEIRFLGIMLE